jgi:hypothetical protein
VIGCLSWFGAVNGCNVSFVSGADRMLQITMQPHGPVYFVAVTGVMIASKTEEINKPSKIQPEQPIESMMMMYKNKSSKQHDTTPSHQSSKGIV